MAQLGSPHDYHQWHHRDIVGKRSCKLSSVMPPRHRRHFATGEQRHRATSCATRAPPEPCRSATGSHATMTQQAHNRARHQTPPLSRASASPGKGPPCPPSPQGTTAATEMSKEPRLAPVAAPQQERGARERVKARRHHPERAAASRHRRSSEARRRCRAQPPPCTPDAPKAQG
jgi:hypothetical protein